MAFVAWLIAMRVVGSVGGKELPCRRLSSQTLAGCRITSRSLRPRSRVHVCRLVRPRLQTSLSTCADSSVHVCRLACTRLQIICTRSSLYTSHVCRLVCPRLQSAHVTRSRTQRWRRWRRPARLSRRGLAQCKPHPHAQFGLWQGMFERRRISEDLVRAFVLSDQQIWCRQHCVSPGGARVSFLLFRLGAALLSATPLVLLGVAYASLGTSC